MTCIWDDMYMVGAHVCREQIPGAVLAVSPQGCEHHLPTVLVEPIGRVPHLPALRQCAMRIWLHQTASKQIVTLIHRA